MTVPIHRGSPDLRVCLLHNYRDAQQFSMKLYADRLGGALEAEHVTVEHLQPQEVLSASFRSYWLGDKIDSYAGRFIRYPRIASTAPPADVYHIVDHGQAHLLKSLDARRTVVTCHDLMLLVLASGRLGQRNSSRVAYEIFRGVAGLLKRAAVVVADSEQTRKDLIQFVDVDPARIDVIFPGLNQAFAPGPSARASGRQRWGLGEERIVLQVGVAFYKNVETCLRTIARIRQRGLAVTLLRGGPRLLPQQSALAERLGIAPFIRDLGPLPDQDLTVLYNTADVLLYPSLYEGFGWPPLEAMACGIPVVCSRAGSLAEVAGPAAMTADPEDVDHLADHVATVLTDSAVAAGLRERGLRHAARFDWSITARKFVDVYQRVRELA